MRALRKIVLIVVGILVILVLVGFLLPSELSIQKSIRIATSEEVLFRKVSNMRNYNDWSPWFKQDPEAEYVFEGPEEGGPGSEIRWKGEVTKEGKMMITRTVPYDSVFMEIYFGKDLKESASSNFYLSEVTPDSVEISWAFHMDMGAGPIGRYIGFFMKKEMATQYEIGLKELKSITESTPPPSTVDVELVQLEARQIIGILGHFNSYSEASFSIKKSFNEVESFVASQQIDTPSYVTTYIALPEEGEAMDYIAGIFREEEMSLPQNFVSHMMPSAQYLRAMHVGPHAGLSEAHAALGQALASGKYTLIGNTWEHYRVYAGVEADSNQWQTDIYYPVRVNDESLGEEPRQ